MSAVINCPTLNQRLRVLVAERVEACRARDGAALERIRLAFEEFDRDVAAERERVQRARCERAAQIVPEVWRLSGGDVDSCVRQLAYTVARHEDTASASKARTAAMTADLEAARARVTELEGQLLGVALGGVELAS